MLAQRTAEGDPMNVKCPYSDTMCAGNQCCPRAEETLNKTYPCPTAVVGWNDCEGSDPGPVPYSYAGNLAQIMAKDDPMHVKCTYSDTMCAGNQCCPRAKETLNKTYPCPSAVEGWN